METKSIFFFYIGAIVAVAGAMLIAFGMGGSFLKDIIAGWGEILALVGLIMMLVADMYAVYVLKIK